MTLPQKVAISIVTFNRPQLLDELLHSISQMAELPWRIVVVDNASTDNTQEIVTRWESTFPAGVLVNALQATNSGGAGGFSVGTQIALDIGADWVWLMDDDVEVLPDAFEKLAPWMERFKVIHGRRYDVDGTPFYWQAKFNQFLGVPLPYSAKDFNADGFAITNSGTFEGMLIAVDTVRHIGLPDPRFFISWDDAIYAWLASRITEVVYVDEFVLQKKRAQKQVNLGVRHLNDSSPLAKYHVMRNRAYVGRYFEIHGGLSRIGFGLGTALTFAKEVFRLVVVERSFTGFDALVRGWKDGRAIWHDTSWQPMPALDAAPTSENGGSL